MSGTPFESFDDDFDEEGPRPPLSSREEQPQAPLRLRPFAWGALIMALIMDPGKQAEVLHENNTTADEVEELFKNNEEFRIAVKECQSVIKAQGPNAGFVLRAKIMAEDLLGDMYMIGKDRNTPAALRIRVAENAAAWGRLDPKHDKGRTDATDTGVHLSFNIIGLERPFPGVVSVEPTRVSEK